MSKYRNTNHSEIANLLKALSHPHRLQIYLRLAKTCSRKDCKTKDDVSSCISDVGTGLNIVPSTLSHHIKELKTAKLVDVKKSGQKNECSVNQENLTKLRDFFKGVGND